VALWATQQLQPLVAGGEFAKGLEHSIHAARTLYARLESDERFIPGPEPELDIVTWSINSPTPEESSRLAQQVFDRAAEQDLHLALVQLPIRFLRRSLDRTVWAGANAEDKVTCLRSVLMKPEHLAWIDQIWERLDRAAACALSSNAVEVK
jgi:hypothetical protein